MAAVDVSRVVALGNKALALGNRGHYARAAEIYAEAVAAAQALHQPDCLIVAHLQAAHTDALLRHAETAGVPETRHNELKRSAFLEVLPAAMASLQRRLAAGTLLPGACRPHEVAWFEAITAHGHALAAKTTQNAKRVPCTAAEISAWSACVGYDACMLTARISLELCALGTDEVSARTLNVPETTAAVACSVFVESAFDMIQLCNLPASTTEAALVRHAQIVIEEEQCFRRTSNEWHARILAAWRRLRSSGVLQRRGILEGVSGVMADLAHQSATAAATAAARGGLRLCALHTCGAQEVHASQFKRCSACSGVVYCCKEHQVQDWPAHRAACRAAG
jgi:hypothetical protein